MTDEPIICLQCQRGTDSVTYGAKGWVVSPFDWRVSVPKSVAMALLGTAAGVVLVDPPKAEEVKGFCFVRHITDRQASFSWRGVSYVPIRGSLEIPAAAIRDAMNHGFVLCSPAGEMKRMK
jgi:hypothetical protein